MQPAPPFQSGVARSLALADEAACPAAPPKVRWLPMRPVHLALILAGQKTTTLRRTAYAPGLYRTFNETRDAAAGILVHLDRPPLDPPLFWTALSPQEQQLLAETEGYRCPADFEAGARCLGIAGIGEFFAGKVPYYRHLVRPASEAEKRLAGAAR